MRVDLLDDEVLLAVGSDTHHPAARVGRPERAVPLRQDTFRPLQIAADLLDADVLDTEPDEGIEGSGVADQGHKVFPKDRGIIPA